MKIINQQVEHWNQSGYREKDIYSHIARCTRVCYQSEKKQDNENDKDFVKRVLLHSKNPIENHGAMLEHGTVYLTIPYQLPTIRLAYILECLIHNKFSKSHYTEGFYHITTNMRVILENEYDDALDFMVEPTVYHEQRTTFSFITSIDISRELNRHRVHSISEESTRYCNYSKDKFGNQVTFIQPSSFKHTITGEFKTLSDTFSYIPIEGFTLEEKVLLELWLDAEDTYLGLLQQGIKPEFARKVLPLSTKTQVIHTAFNEDWKHFIELRYKDVSGKAHPDIKYLAKQVYNHFYNE